MLLSMLVLGLVLRLVPAYADNHDRIQGFDNNSATIYVYYRVGDDLHPDTNIRKEQFESHVKELTSGNYNIISLQEIVAALKSGKSLPKKTVAITFDGGYRSIAKNALPLLDEHKLPYTIFLSTDIADASYNAQSYLLWKDIKKLARKDHVSIGLHPAPYDRIFDLPKSDIQQSVNKAISRYREELGSEPMLFSYPFGEYSKTYKDVIKTSGFDAAMTQNTGKAHKDSDFLALPRFTMTENYSNLDRFRMTGDALPLPIYDIHPQDPYIQSQDIPLIGFTLHDQLAEKAEKMSCFLSGHGKIEHEMITAQRVQIKAPSAITERRVRVNCTVPEKNEIDPEQVKWRWFGMLLTHTPEQQTTD